MKSRGAALSEARVHTGKRLRILHVEDDPNDMELIRAALESAGVECMVEVVSDGKSFVTALERGGFDLILSDYSLPGFDGFTALKIARQRSPRIPFIIVSGTLGEETAIDSLQAGATDYVLKHRLERLAPAARRALNEAEERLRRNQAEEALQNEQQFLRAILDRVEAGIVACDSAGVVTLFNRAARSMHGLSEKSGMPDRWPQDNDLYQPDGKTLLKHDESPLQRALQGEAVRNAELLIIPKSGPSRTVLTSGQPIVDAQGRKRGAVIALQDITERKLLESQLRQAQKMEAIGLLAGGVAHDFNNLLNVILGYSEMVLTDLPTDNPHRPRIEQVRKAGERAASLTRQLLAFSRKQVLQPRVLDLNTLLVEMEKMLRRLIAEDIEFTIRAQPGALRIKADPGQVEQVAMNLVVNARDAMPQGGRLTIETGSVELDERFARDHPGARPGAYVRLAISDTGCGMTSEIQARIFEPFFTTKEAGKGTGMGLATVYGIIKQSGGYIDVQSEPGHGTTFTVYLPPTLEATETVETRDPAASPRGTETILLVEDDPGVRNVVRDSLRIYGYTVLESGDPEEGIGICERHEGTIHLLMTDVILPKMSGRALATRLSAVRPDMKILFMSGYTDDAIGQHGVLDRGVDFLQKPFHVIVMVRKIREVLDKQRPA